MDKCDYNLAADIAADCDNLPVKGLGNNGYILNFDEIDKAASAYDATTKSILKSLVMQTGKKAYRVFVPGKTPFTGTNKALAVGTYMNTWTKQIKLVVLDEGPDVCANIIDKLANGRFVLILENKASGSGGKATYEVYGYEAGLTATEMANDKYSEETNGGYSCTLEETGATKSGLFLYAESATATRTMLDSLVAGTKS